MRADFILLVILSFSDFCRSRLLSVYWGQDSSSGISLSSEKDLIEYCDKYSYDVIPIAFVDVFFDPKNKDKLPRLDLSNHCSETFKDLPHLLDCPHVGEQIEECQKKGKKILISLGGAEGTYGFNSLEEAHDFARNIWNLFLGGSSDTRPFRNAILDGVDLDIEKDSPQHYSDFVRSLRLLMAEDINKKYLITGAPQCPYPDDFMGPVKKGTVLDDIGEEFDYLFVQFYNNYCCLGAEKYFEESINKWFDFTKQLKSSYGKGPLILIGLPSHPRASGGKDDYQSPERVEQLYETVKNHNELGGIMLWDASFDSNNVIDGQFYSSLLKRFLNEKDAEGNYKKKML